MQMSCDHVQRRIGHRLMPKQERRQADRVVDLHLQLCMRQMQVVVSAQHVHVQRGIAFAPAQPVLVPRRAMRRPMQDVAEDPQFAAGMRIQHPLQAAQVVNGSATGQGDAGTTENICLAEVQVGDQQVLDRIGTQALSLQQPASLTPLGFPLWAERLRGQFSNEDWRTRVQRAAQQLERRHGR